MTVYNFFDPVKVRQLYNLGFLDLYDLRGLNHFTRKADLYQHMRFTYAYYRSEHLMRKLNRRGSNNECMGDVLFRKLITMSFQEQYTDALEFRIKEGDIHAS